MESYAFTVISQFYDNIDVFLLIFVRLLAFFLLLPVISGMSIPISVKLTLAVCISVVIFMSGAVTTVTYHNSIAGYFILILTEFLTGIFMGYVLFFIFNIIFYTGQLIDYQIGLSMMSVLDPVSQIQVPVVGNLYYLAVSAMLVVTGGLHSFIGAFFYSYQILPIGVANIIGNAPLAWYMLTLLTEFIVVAVKIALPIVGSILLIDVALGIMVKAVPQMNVFVVGMPIKLMVGLLLLLSVLGPTLGTIYNHLFELAYDALINTIWGMAP